MLKLTLEELYRSVANRSNLELENDILTISLPVLFQADGQILKISRVTCRTAKLDDPSAVIYEIEYENVSELAKMTPHDMRIKN